MTRRLLLLSLLGLVACTSWTAAPTPKADGPRLVSLSPAITETLGALGATDTLVGRSDWCTYPPEVISRPALGSSLTPDLEGLASLQPSRILIEDHGGDAAATLTPIAPVQSLPWLQPDDIQASTRRLGALTGREEQAEALADRLEAGLVDTAGPDAPRVLAVLGTDAPAGEVFYVRADSLHGAVLRAAGGRNVLPDPPAGAPTLTAERLIGLDPEVIVLLEARPLTDAQVRAAVQAWTVLTPISAVQSGRIHVLHGDGLLSTGPRVLDLVPRLRAVLAGSP